MQEFTIKFTRVETKEIEIALAAKDEDKAISMAKAGSYNLGDEVESEAIINDEKDFKVLRKEEIIEEEGFRL